VVDVFLDFSKVFDTVPHSIPLDRFFNSGMSRFMVHWVKNWLKGRAQRGVVMGLYLAGNLSAVVFLRVQFWGQFCSIYLSMI